MIKLKSSLCFSLFLLLLFALLFPACVSKKKYIAEVDRRTNCDSILQQFNTRNLGLNKEIANLKLQLAEKTGEGNAFREIIDKQDIQIDRLEEEIEKLTHQTLDQQSLMDGALQQKSRELERQKAILKSLKDEANAHEEKMKNLIGKIANEMTDFDAEGLGLEIRKGNAHIRLSESLIFRKGTTRLNTKALEILEKIGFILMDYPAFKITVIGHTDNRLGKTDNWDLSTLRATALVRALTQEVGISPNQIIAAGKGEYKPITSNETADGRAKNRRTEIVISAPVHKVLEKIKAGN